MSGPTPTPTPTPRPCYVALNGAQVRYLKLFAGPDVDPNRLSIEELHFRGRESEKFLALQVGDGCTYDSVYVRLPEGKDVWLSRKNLRVVEGDLRKVPKRGRIRMGNTGLMGRLSRAIKSGRAFRGR